MYIHVYIVVEVMISYGTHPFASSRDRTPPPKDSDGSELHFKSTGDTPILLQALSSKAKRPPGPVTNPMLLGRSNMDSIKYWD